MTDADSTQDLLSHRQIREEGEFCAFTYIDGSALLLWINLTFVKLDLFAKLADILR